MMIDDQKVLKRFVEKNDGEAFGTLVKKYRGLVFSAAWRRSGQNRSLAEEASQNTFSLLARKASRLVKHPTLGGWLYRAAMLESSSLARAERIRQRKHEELRERERVRVENEGEELTARLIDEAMAKLSPFDRDLLILRFYEDLSFSEIATKVGRSAAACQKRSGRAVEKLAVHLKRMGMPGPASSAITAMIATGLDSEASGIGTKAIVEKALTQSQGGGPFFVFPSSFLRGTIGKALVSGALTLALLVPIQLLSKETERLQRELDRLAGQLGQLKNGTNGTVASGFPSVIGESEGAIVGLGGSAPEKQPDAVAASVAAAAFFGRLKREEIRYAIKYADGIPAPEEETYLEYISDMDAFMRLMGEGMNFEPMEAAMGDFNNFPVADKIPVLVELATVALGLAPDQNRAVKGLLESSLHDFDFLEESERPDVPEALAEWKESRAHATRALWDQVHELLTDEQQVALEKGFPRASIASRSINVSFPRRRANPSTKEAP
ncbi:MAG: sigma-70 family RNA polymerase sigma factor [Verrucomicrobiota bacterium]